PEAEGQPRWTLAEIDASCRRPVVFLLSAAALWLAIGACLGVITSIKAHAPGFLAAPAWLTYGRVRPAAADAFVYGFLVQTGLATGLWMICRLGRSVAQGTRIMTAAAALWNIGLILGLVDILAG